MLREEKIWNQVKCSKPERPEKMVEDNWETTRARNNTQKIMVDINPIISIITVKVNVLNTIERQILSL